MHMGAKDVKSEADQNVPCPGTEASLVRCQNCVLLNEAPPVQQTELTSTDVSCTLIWTDSDQC